MILIRKLPIVIMLLLEIAVAIWFFVEFVSVHIIAFIFKSTIWLEFSVFFINSVFELI